MQQRGQPPQEIVDELAPGMSFENPLSGLGGPGGEQGDAADCCIM